MLNVNELESKWRIYKIKSFIPYAVITVSLGVIFILTTTIYNSKTATKEILKVEKKEPNVVKRQETPAVKRIEENITKIVKATIPKAEVLKEKLLDGKKIILSPSLSFMSNMQDSTISYYDGQETPTSTSRQTTIKQKKQEQTIVDDQPVEIEVLEEEIIKESNVKIKRQNTQEDISHVIKRFKKNNNPALSLFVAKKYYGLGEYNKAYNYALITNEINDNIDASWIIFAKSLVKLNEKDEAIKTLKKYVDHSHSNQAKILLEEITSGKFK